ncbi:uncharacterized protein G2W53_033745 [Senna tora]|uniref:Uncharacterized protein n=1 Tax=Senna tora TaxID=362788 RepID=A0A834SZ68_9FABA|nr:uncharacterized protein G2W53_033745 [Senna tora]
MSQNNSDSDNHISSYRGLYWGPGVQGVVGAGTVHHGDETDNCEAVIRVRWSGGCGRSCRRYPISSPLSYASPIRRSCVTFIPVLFPCGSVGVLPAASWLFTAEVVRLCPPSELLTSLLVEPPLLAICLVGRDSPLLGVHLSELVRRSRSSSAAEA